ncbi:uncharacterized protein J3R85_004294 [Psidium guajava]|nr:uncharacterized protein J3R85_004294 [Psidium guajava]
MDVISQLQEQVDTIASIAVDTFGSLQRDALSGRLSANYPEPPSACRGRRIQFRPATQADEFCSR